MSKEVSFEDSNKPLQADLERNDDEYANTAARIVNDAINDAIHQLEKHFAEELGFDFQGSNLNDVKENIAEMFDEKITEYDRTKTPLLIDASQPKKETQNIEWMTIDNFGRDIAESKIDEFIKNTWKYENSWLYCIDYLGEQEQMYDMRYNFKVRWSIPTRRKPIPRATASVYFTFSVSKIKPGHFPVDVYYVFETNRLVHRPGKSIFREKWLKDIIESKVQLYQAMTF
ncbi:AKAP14 [Bugula neritina]|uniref:AKAP14 n=1 Tax=Bugula neritina TaxID=10212 RepID=A0A7J7IYV5_BUGNE|nr:AKAP14 [Bugula neritina]